MNQDKIRVLLADDNKDFCDILKNYLINNLILML